MRFDKIDNSALINTIEMMGYHSPSRDIECIAFSKPSVSDNKLIHTMANEQLLAVLLKNEPGPCIHITGEMRALSDPFHRRLCVELAKRSKVRFTVIYNIPDEYCDSPKGVGEWNAKTWQSKSWIDKLSAINMIGDAFVDVRSYNTENEIQYSVFGNRYILLQEKHSYITNNLEAKRIWLLKSEKLNRFLTEHALSVIEKSKDIPEALFRRFFAKINGITARNILAKLPVSGEALPIDKIIDKEIMEFDPNAANDVYALKTIGFIIFKTDDTLSLSTEGRQFIELFR